MLKGFCKSKDGSKQMILLGLTDHTIDQLKSGNVRNFNIKEQMAKHFPELADIMPNLEITILYGQDDSRLQEIMKELGNGLNGTVHEKII